MRINAHSHLLPYPEEIPLFMKEKEVFWIDKDRKYMRQKDWSRPITDKSFFLDEKLIWMENNRLDRAVVLNLSQLYCNGMERQLTHDVLRFQNDFNASLQERYPTKFTSGFVVQAAYVDDALKEIDRCVHELKMKVLCLPTHYVTRQGEWRSIADETCYPIFELADRYGLSIEIHPYDGPEIIALQDRYWRFHLVWMCALTADTYHFFSLLDFAERYPNIRTCFAHGNQFGQMNVGRRTQGFEGRPDLFQGAVHPRKIVGAKNVYFDTLVHDTLSLELLIKRQGISQILAGLDDPYPLGEMESVPGCYPGKVIDDAVRELIITEVEKDHIWNKNVQNWLGELSTSS